MNSEEKKHRQVVFTNKAECRDCYRCLRVCPVKAIKMSGGQASVEEDRCIACGTCIRECPQGAKTFRNDLESAIKLISENKIVAATVAPSFAAFFKEWEAKRLPSALRKLGFSFVAETAVGAYPAAIESLKKRKKNTSSICTACPAVVGFVEKYMPDLTENLVEVASPMITHGRMLKKKLGSEAKVIFIGPCVAKKAEAEKKGLEGVIDCVLTFSELNEWFERENVQLDRILDSNFDEEPAGDARFFPLPGGLTRTASLGADALAADVVAVSGIDDVRKLLENLRTNDSNLLVEPLFCSQGCVNGPAVPVERNLFNCRSQVLKYAADHKGRSPADNDADANAGAIYTADSKADEKSFSEQEIQKVLEATGKSNPEDQLDCGACGYQTCREKAIAVLRGLAETEMCIPYMRRLAEQRTDRIIETSPNGIVILDDKLNIISMNPAFRKMFYCSEAVLGKHVSYLVDPQPFEKILTQEQRIVEETVTHSKYNLIAHQIIYPLEAEKQIVGIFVNITNSKQSQEELANLRSKTIKQAREMLEHQISMAQQIALYLGESTARGEDLIENLMKMAADDNEEERKKNRSRWDIFTSK